MVRLNLLPCSSALIPSLGIQLARNDIVSPLPNFWGPRLLIPHCRVSRTSHTAHSVCILLNLCTSTLQAPMYYRNAHCAVVVYDITQSVRNSACSSGSCCSLGPTTFRQASLEKARSWIRELQRQADPSIVIALCGNKTDLAARRQVTQEEAQKYAEEEGLMWMEASAKTGEGVQDIFMAIGTYVPGFSPDSVPDPSYRLSSSSCS